MTSQPLYLLLRLVTHHAHPCCDAPQDADGSDLGVAGTLELLADRNVSTQPIASFDWSPDKEGLFVSGSFDQCIRVGVVTKLNKV